MSMNKKAKKETVFKEEKLPEKLEKQALIKLIFTKKENTTLVSTSQKNQAVCPNRKSVNIAICWKQMSLLQQMIAIGAYINTNTRYRAFTLRLSYAKMDVLEKEAKPADFLRRRIYATFRKKFSKRVPKYGFILEKSLNGFLHLHGIIDLTEFPERKAKNVLKLCAFGTKFKGVSMHKYILKIKEIFEGTGWLAYIAKNPKLEKSYIYMANSIKNETKKFLTEIVNER